jgi:hypothetical protein
MKYQTTKYCAAVKWETRKIHSESWNRYISNIESDIYGAQNTACKIMKKLSKKEKDDFQEHHQQREVDYLF